jgi:glycosyltransferase involved in cell wall biosynthesis
VTHSLIIDVTQYAHWPATSGVQRVLQHLAQDWPSMGIDARYGFLHEGRYTTGPLSALGTVIASIFRAGGTYAPSRAEFVIDSLRSAADERIEPDELDRHFDGYLLPEPTLRADNLDVAAQLEAVGRTPTFFIYFDALPLTHPQFYPRGADSHGAVGRYHRAVARSENVAFISASTKALFEQRIARRTLDNAIVAKPGADGLPAISPTPPDRPTFAVLGTVEPRKRHRLVLDAFEDLWAAGRDYQLVVLGSPGWEEPDFLARLRLLCRTTDVEWIETAGDREVATAVSRSSAVVFASHAEGYGLPPLEALAVGCPAIVSSDLPAFEDLPEAGQIRLAPVTRDAIASAVEALANPASNAAARQAIEGLRLPTWRQFVSDVEQWIASALELRRTVRASFASR